MIRLRRHPKKDIEKALASARKAGWTVIPTASEHRWGELRCPSAGVEVSDSHRVDAA